MGLFLCRRCGQEISLSGKSTSPHECEPEKIDARIDWLEGRVSDCERRAATVKDFLEHTLASVAVGNGLDAETVEVSSQWLRKLWDGVSGGKWEYAQTADSFLLRQMAIHAVFRAANDLFRYRPHKTGISLAKLERLRAECVTAYRTLYGSEIKFDLSAEDVADLLEGKK